MRHWADARVALADDASCARERVAADAQVTPRRSMAQL
jgi:hypothetical protein